MISDVFCDCCDTHCDYGDIVWMDKEGVVCCPSCYISLATEYVVIEWPHEQGTSVLHTVEAMKLNKWR